MLNPTTQPASHPKPKRLRHRHPMAAAASRSTGNSLLRVSQACETLKDGFNSGKAAAVRSCLVSRAHAVAESERNRNGNAENSRDTAGRGLGPGDALLPVRRISVSFGSLACF